MNGLSFLSALVAIIYISLGIYFYNLNKGESVNKLLLILCICFFDWSFAYIFWYSKEMIQTQYYPFINILGATGWSFYYGVIFHVSFEIVGLSSKIKSFYRKTLIYVPCTIMFIIYSMLRILKIDYYSLGFSIFNVTNFLITATYISIGLVLILRWGLASKIYREKKQAFLVVFFGAIAFILGIFCQNILPLLKLPTLYIAQIVSVFWVFGIFFAISKYDFLDIKSVYNIDKIMKNVNDTVIIVDNKNKITYFNENLQKFYKKSSNEILGSEIYDIIKFRFKSKKNDFTNCTIEKNGEEISVSVSTEEIFDNYGDRIGRLFVIKDNSQYIQIEKEKNKLRDILLKNDISYNLLINQSHNAILVHRDGEILFGNESATKLCGYISANNFIGTNIWNFIPDVDMKDLKLKYFNIINDKCSLTTFNGRILKSNGDMIEVENTSSYFEYGGQPTILSIMRDVSPEKKVKMLEIDVLEKTKLLDESLEMNKIITEFFSNVSHELKTPLNVIFSAIQTLGIYNDNSYESIIKRQRYHNIMKQNCYRLTRLINNLLDITKIDSGFLSLNFKNYNIVSIIEDITLSVVPYVENHEINLIFDTDIEEKIIACDPDRIELIMLNLISNSLKFTNAQGEIFVSIMDGTDFITILVKDTGLGMSKESLASIFDRFSQVDKTLTRNREGSGIGLYLVKSFVEMHNGKITVSSELGKGSEFVIKLPVRMVDTYLVEDSQYDINVEKIHVEFSDIYS
ncbi:ATP-binding protein [Clostridium grantii]|uniref:histidine kinase n=1 Tax=Clostridium grantii DSM 8605 TaxID=1121316 RepID=A0A1M5VQ70_9CLOT|nr:ATP-binding protein [Clostridium grantii]SHH77431.1 PAS domain S-box-containing protein [Clostridium grantii DSM 8605]